MAEITQSTDYPDGAALDVAAHNDNVHSPTGGKGIMSEANGKLTVDNLRTEFKIKDKHVMYEQAALARHEPMRKTCTIYADAVPTPKNTTLDTSSTKRWFTLPGCSVRWYQPFDVSAALIHWTFFASCNRWKGWAFDRSDEMWRIDPKIAVVGSIDGELKPITKRYMPPTHFVPISPGGRNPGLSLHGSDSEVAGNPAFVSSESHTALHWDMFAMANTLTKGFHEVSMKCRIESTRAAEIFMKSAGSKAFDSEFQIFGYFFPTNNLSLGIRNARVLTLL
tara:strand:+ start:270 stop:1106 length:837 start_codon:yes stop_codon:yes gene_type:complete